MVDQKSHKCRSCGTMKHHRRLLDSVPGYAEARQKIEEQAYRAAIGLTTGRTGCTKVPVVVHVVWKTPEQNISQAQIDSQIAILNEDYRKRNADVANVPAPFEPLVGDARIEFELATVDPDGNPTNGVNRRETDQNSFDDDDAVKFQASGGIDAWPADQYLNIWVCELAGGLLGYAQFPGGPATTDGVVITHTGFGNTGTAAAPFDKGRTATHEIGHWLNLRHIWGDDGDGCGGSDFVADTPNQAGSNVGKPTFPSISCNNGPNGDMFMNYMDYVDDDTMVMFSEGQTVRMQAALDGPRSLIGTTTPCGGPKSMPKDGPKDLPKDLPKDPPKLSPQDPPKSVLEPPKSVYEPPKSIYEPPKSIFEPPKSVYDPPKGILDPPKTFYEPPIEFPMQALLSALQQSIWSSPQLPFVLATGLGMRSTPDLGRTQALEGYQFLLSQYAQLYQRGMLDTQGHAAWQQAYAAYRQLGGV